MADSLPQDQQPAKVVERLLTQHGPMSVDELSGALRGSGVALSGSPGPTLDGVLDELACPARTLADERWVWLPALLAGRVFTYRLGKHEIEYDVLDVTPDLDPVTELTEHEAYQRLAGGAFVRPVLADFDVDLLDERGIPSEVIGEGGALLLEAGTLAGLGAGEGDVIGLRLTPAGLALEVVDVSAAGPERLAALSDRLSAVLSEGEPEYTDVAVWSACAEDSRLFAEPLPPLSEVLDGLGWARDGDWLARPGFDFPAWRAENMRNGIAARNGMGEDQALAVHAMVAFYDQLVTLLETAREAMDAGGADALEQARVDLPYPAGELWAAVKLTAGLLADPDVAVAVLAETLGVGSEDAAALGMLAEAVEAQAPRPARVALRWLRAMAHERLGQTAEAEAGLLSAESVDPQWPPVLLDLARYASDRGDADRGLALLRRAGAEPEHPLMELLERFQTAPRPDLGRNQSCWCGSGRKYKKCHLGREQAPLADRAAWLYQKASQFVLLGPGARDVVAVQAAGAHFAASSDMSDDPHLAALAVDAVLFEGGAFDDFVATRGDLLPDDERLLADQWLLVERSVFEITEVRRGEGVTVRDVRTGDVHQVRERAGSQHLTTGQLVCTRVVPAGDTMQFFGGVAPVALHTRDPLIELLDAGPDPEELVAFLARRLAPPTLANTEGDPLVFCVATLKVGAPTALATQLDETYDRVSEFPQWFEHVTTQGMERIRATLRLEDDVLHVETNSEVRVDRVLDVLHRLDASLEVVEQSRRPARDTREAAEMAQHLPRTGQSTHFDPADPELAAALTQFTRDYERKWLDEPIPALAGRTPRQAAADPTRRGDLIKLIGTFPAAESRPGMMDPDRLRSALGLEVPLN